MLYRLVVWRHQTIIWTNVDMSFRKMNLKNTLVNYYHIPQDHCVNCPALHIAAVLSLNALSNIVLVRCYIMEKIWTYVRWTVECIISHYSDVIMDTMASQITSLTIVYSTVYSSTDQRKHQSSASLAFVRGMHRWPVNSPHKGPVTRKMLPFDDVIIR